MGNTTNEPIKLHWKHDCGPTYERDYCYSFVYAIGVKTKDGDVHFFFSNFCPEHRLLFERAKRELGEDIEMLGGYAFLLTHEFDHLSPAKVANFRSSASYGWPPRDLYRLSMEELKKIIPEIKEDPDLF